MVDIRQLPQIIDGIVKETREIRLFQSLQEDEHTRQYMQKEMKRMGLEFGRLAIHIGKILGTKI